jgi:hypothetical protein
VQYDRAKIQMTRLLSKSLLAIRDKYRFSAKENHHNNVANKNLMAGHSPMPNCTNFQWIFNKIARAISKLVSGPSANDYTYDRIA